MHVSYHLIFLHEEFIWFHKNFFCEIDRYELPSIFSLFFRKNYFTKNELEYFFFMKLWHFIVDFWPKFKKIRSAALFLSWTYRINWDRTKFKCYNNKIVLLHYSSLDWEASETVRITGQIIGWITRWITCGNLW